MICVLTMGPANPDPGALFSGGVYERGAMALHALRGEIGDEAFFKTLREYVSRHAPGNVTTEDLVAVAEEVAGRDLDGLFDSWLFGETTPFPPESERAPGNRPAPSRVGLCGGVHTNINDSPITIGPDDSNQSPRNGYFHQPH